MENKTDGLSIFHRLLITFLIVIISINLILTTVFYIYLKDSFITHANERVIQELGSTRHELHHLIIEMLQRDLLIMSSNPIVNDFMMSSESEYDINARAMKRMFLQSILYTKNYTQISFVDFLGKEKIRVGRKGSLFGNRDFSERYIFKDIESSSPGVISVEGPYFNENEKAMFSAGIFKTDQDIGEFGGAIILEFNIESFLDDLNKKRIFGENPFWLFTPEGKVIKRPENNSDILDPTPYFSNEFQKNLQLLIVKEGILVYQDLPMIHNSQYLRMAISIPSTLILKDIHSALHFFSIVFLISILILFLVIYYLSKRISRPIIKLAKAADRLAKGDLSTQVAIKTTGEVQMLVNSFNHMADDLQYTTVSKDYFDSIFTSMLESLIVMSPEGTIQKTNRAACMLLEYEENELVGQAFKHILNEDLPFEIERLDREMLSDAALKSERTYTAKSGRKIPVLFSASVMKSEHGIIEGIVCAAHDITERKHTEEMLEKLRKQNELILNAAGEGIYGLDLDGNTTFVNPAAAEMIGWEKHELIGKNQHTILHHSKEDGTLYPKEECHIYAVLKDGKTRRINNEVFWRKDGSCFPVEYISSPIFNNEGDIAGAVVIFTDITMRKQAEMDLMASESKYRNLLETASDLVQSVDMEGNFLYVNKKWREVLGYTEEEVTHMKFVDVISKEHLPNCINNFKEICAGNTINQMETEFITKSGTSVYVEGNISMQFKDNTFHATQGIFRDISYRKKAKEELIKFNERLEQSNMELEQFAYVASHDLQEPLRKITVFGDRLVSKYYESLGEQGRDYLKRMKSASTRMHTLINDLLTFSRVTTKAQPFTNVDLNIVIEEVLSDLEVRIDEIKGRVDIGDLETISADPLQMRQLFQNLISNALKFHKIDEPPVIKIHGKLINQNEDAEENGFYRLTIEDNGIGFNEKHADRIFGVFQRLHNRNEYQGTGIGLSVCKRIVERHSGNIRTSSSEGHGTKFIITLPVKQTISELEHETQRFSPN